MCFEIGEAVLVNKWSFSFNTNDCYLPEQNIFPKQTNLFGEYCLFGIVLESYQDMCLVWISEFDKKFYFKYEDMKKCQDL